MLFYLNTCTEHYWNTDWGDELSQLNYYCMSVCDRLRYKSGEKTFNKSE